MTRILLVRHGESEWNADGRWQGQADPPLTDLGRMQAKTAAQSIGAVDAIACSDLERARVTAGIIADQLGIGPVQIDPGFRERDAGEWSGLTRAQIHRDWPGYLPDDPLTPPADRDNPRRPPSWEPDEQLLVRVLTSVHALDEQLDGGEAVVVTHGGVIFAIEAHLGQPWARLANLGARWLTVDHGRLELGPRIVLLDPHDVTVTTPGQI